MGEVMDDLLRWLPVIILFVQVVMAWVLWSLKQSFISRRECEDCRKEAEKKKEKTDTRVGAIETGVHKLPERSELQELSNKIGRLTEKLGKLDGRLTGINRAVDLLNQHHINSGT